MTTAEPQTHSPSAGSGKDDQKSAATLCRELMRPVGSDIGQNQKGLTLPIPERLSQLNLFYHAILSWAVVQAQYEGQDQVIFDAHIPADELPSATKKLDEGIEHELSGSTISLYLEMRPEMITSEAFMHVEQRVTASSQMENGSLKQFSSAKTVLWLDNGKTPICEANTSLFGKSESRIGDIMTINPLDWKELQERNSKAPPRVDECVHDVIRERCLQQPHALAICSHEGEITYQDLLTLASLVARALQNRGVGPGTFVPLCFPKTHWAMVSVLGVMMAGGAFVLLETAYPLARLVGICETLEPRVVLCVSRTSDLAQHLAPDVLIVNDEDSLRSDAAATSFRSPSVGPSDAIYAVFTSGSTGVPKGVVIQHRAYSSAARTHIEKFHMDAQSRVLQFASYAFDIALLKILTTLMVGGCLCVLGDTQRTDSFVQSARAMRPSHAFLTPSFIRSLSVEDVDQIGIHTLVLIGEKVTPMHLDSCSERVRVINGYGPAECTPITTIYPDLRAAANPSNVGWSQCSACWVVDPRDHNRLAPIGAVGELIIEGWNVGREYLKDAAKTQAAFISSPEWLISVRGTGNTIPLYKTSDLVQQLPDGSLVCAGRKGTQVKLRGQRLELEEVETHCRGYFPQAVEIVADVITIDGNSEDAFLVLVVVIRPAEESEDNQVILPPTDDFVVLADSAKEGLKRILPSYMVPSIILPSAGLPKNVSRKMDRQQLRRCIANLSPPQLRGYQVIAPSDSDSGVLIGKTLDEKPISLPWGGNSISAMRVASTARSQNLSLVASDLLSHPTLSSLAEYANPIEPIVFDTTPFSLIGAPEEALGPFYAKLHEKHVIPEGANILDMAPLTNYQCEMLETGGLDSFMFIYDGPVDKDRLRNACQTVWDLYPMLRTVFVPMGDNFVQIVLSHVNLPFDAIETEEAVEPVTTSCAKKLCQRSSLGSLGASLTLVSSRDGGQHGFVITLSHLQYDGISMHFIANDIALAYCGKVPAPRPDYFNYLYFRAQHCLDDAFSFWKQYLQQAPVNRLLEKYHTEDPSPPLGMAWCSSQELTIRIPSFSQRVTLATLVRAAWSVALGERYQESDVMFQQTVHGRDSTLANVDQIFGPCINKIPFRITIDSTKSVQQFLSSVQDQQAKALRYDYVDMPDILRRSTSWPAGTRMAWHLLHQNFDATWKCPLDEVDARAQEISDGHPPKSESGLGICTVQGNSLHLVVVEIGTPGDFSPAQELVRRWAELVEKFSCSLHSQLQGLVTIP
ncbi:hypothetical protein N7530_006150 [Penicillium desertorum]|uniref:Carrier domain-containing protein n=1 Tax=Penicillium desertorum TaxID=1303715 RepID=A0A9W9X1F3_9EURO|nr:hypothetical protein N7530_006150 [Penicillium desertorum]